MSVYLYVYILYGRRIKIEREVYKVLVVAGVGCRFLGG